MKLNPELAPISRSSAAQIPERWQAITTAETRSGAAGVKRPLLTEVVADKLRDVVLRWSDGSEDALPFFLHLPDAVDRLSPYVPGVSPGAPWVVMHAVLRNLSACSSAVNQGGCVIAATSAPWLLVTVGQGRLLLASHPRRFALCVWELHEA